MKKQETFVEGLTTILLKQRAINPDEAKALTKTFNDRSQIAFDDFLLEEGLVSRTAVLNALSEYFQVPAFDVTGYFFEHYLLHEFPKDFLLRHLMIPVERDQNTLFVVANNPGDPTLLANIGKHVSYDIQFMVGLAQDINDAIREFYDKSITQVSMDDDVDRTIEETHEVEEVLHPHTRQEEE
ncbi:MAG: bacteriophage N4 adsorption protein B [Candidatus Dependentiae bacterium ADurb.Bin331]|nr:MAG: bacteriophage N4 adsorption protein B [Candidatus Dependentiae bacterium ADurb.Bin331]